MSESNETVLCETPLPGSRFWSLKNTDVLYGRGVDKVTSVRPDVTVLVATSGPVGPELLDLLPNLRLVARFGVGYDEVDVDECTRRKVQVSVTPGAVEVATAELAIALMLSARLRITSYDQRVRHGQWSEPVSVMPDREGSFSARLGVVGFGRIGRRVAETARSLGMEIAYSGRNRAPRHIEHALNARWLPLEEIMRSSDVISLHCPLNESTRGLISRRHLALMRDGACLVNTSRGPIVDQAALIEQLETGRIIAGLDVFDGEPEVPVGLRALDNVVLSPHVGSATRFAREDMTDTCLMNVEAVLAGKPAPYLVSEQQFVKW